MVSVCQCPRETWIQSQFESYQRLKKWYLMLPCLTFSIIRYRSRVKWSNPGKGVAPSLTPRCSSYRKGRLGVTLDFEHQQLMTLFCADIIRDSVSLLNFPLTNQVISSSIINIGFFWNFILPFKYFRNVKLNKKSSDWDFLIENFKSVFNYIERICN